jgi:hypothetical protein
VVTRDGGRSGRCSTGSREGKAPSGKHLSRRLGGSEASLESSLRGLILAQGIRPRKTLPVYRAWLEARSGLAENPSKFAAGDDSLRLFLGSPKAGLVPAFAPFQFHADFRGLGENGSQGKGGTTNRQIDAECTSACRSGSKFPRKIWISKGFRLAEARLVQIAPVARNPPATGRSPVPGRRHALRAPSASIARPQAGIVRAR